MAGQALALAAEATAPLPATLALPPPVSPAFQLPHALSAHRAAALPAVAPPAAVSAAAPHAPQALSVADVPLAAATLVVPSAVAAPPAVIQEAPLVEVILVVATVDVAKDKNINAKC